MTEVIQTLCEIDNSASRILESVNEQKEQLSKVYDERFLKIIKELDEQTEERLERLNDDLDQEVRSQLQKMKEDAAQNLKDLDDNYKKYHEQYADAIFQRIIGV